MIIAAYILVMICHVQGVISMMIGFAEIGFSERSKPYKAACRRAFAGQLFQQLKPRLYARLILCISGFSDTASIYHRDIILYRKNTAQFTVAGHPCR